MRFLLLLLAGVAHAQTPIASSIRDFSGGLNNEYASTYLAENESPRMMNVLVDEIPGALVQRNGWQTCGVTPSGNTATNLYEYARNDGSRNLIITDNESIWQTGDCVVHSTVATGLSAIALPRFATVLDNLWVVNGSTYPMVWNGTTLSRLDGLGGRPTGPIGKYITYWKSRVWIANTPTSPSSVFFSVLVDDTGAILNPATSTGAWTNTNQIFINRDDGSGIAAMRAYRDNLYIGKETGWNRIVFEDDFNVAIAKNVTTIGTKFNESVIEMDDGLLRFVGRDGIYAFDGARVQRLSSKWGPTFETFKQPSIGEQYKLWDTDNDFNGGVFSGSTIAYESGSVSLDFNISSRVYDTFTDGDFSSSPVWTFGTGTNRFEVRNGQLSYFKPFSVQSETGFLYSSTKTLNFGNWSLDISALQVFQIAGINENALSASRYYFISSTSDTATTSGYFVETNCIESINFCKLKLVKSVSGSLETLAEKTYNPSFVGGYRELSCPGLKVAVSQSGVFTISTGAYTGSAGFDIQHTDPNFVKGGSNFNIIYMAQRRDNTIGLDDWSGIFNTEGKGTRIDNIYITGNTTGSGVFTSEITTATNISGWKTFEVDQTLSGQNITYEVRTGTTVFNTLLNSWRAITPGAVVSTTTDGFAQWRANFSTTDNSVTPLLNSASLGWLTGGSSKSALYAINYKSRYWLSASTTLANDFNDITMIESKSPLNTYSVHDLPISAMAVWNRNLYGAIGNTSKIARLDFGSTDDGKAITSFWESRDQVYENPIFYKTINTAILDYSNTPANTGLKIGLSSNEGQTWEERTVNLAASTLSRNTAKLNFNADTGLGFRTRIYNDVPGIGFKVYGLYTFGTQTNYYGND